MNINTAKLKSNKKFGIAKKTKTISAKLTELKKKEIEEYLHPIIEDFKKQFIPKKPNKKYNYLVDIYSMWYQNHFYLCEKFEPGQLNNSNEGFEMKFVRLRYIGKDKFDLSYFRHTSKWELVFDSLTLDECKEMIVSVPVFHPIG